MKKALSFLLLGAFAIALIGCNSGTITSEQTVQKNEALHKIAVQKEGPGFVDDRGRQ